MANEFYRETEESIGRLFERNGFETVGDPEVRVSSYITENPDQLYIEFEIEFICRDTTEQNRTQAVLTLKGDATSDPRGKVFSAIRNQGEELNYVDSEGEQQVKTSS